MDLQADLAQRSLLAGLVAALLLLMHRPGTAILFAGAFLVNEGIEYFANQWVLAAKSTKPWLARGMLVNWLIGSLTWSGLGVFLWIYGSNPEKLFALAIMVGGLVHVIFHYAKWVKGVITAGMPFLIGMLIMAFRTLSLQAEVRAHILVFVSFIGLVFYLAYAAYTSVVRQRELTSAVLRASEANEAKSAFLANMSHEIRTPLNGIVGMSALMRRTELSDEQCEMLELIEGSSDTLIRVIGDVLDLSKVEAGELHLEARPFNVEDMLKTINIVSQLRAEEKGLEFRFQAENVADTWLLGDETRIRQIAHNLISNAIKFTDEGWVSVKLCVAPGTDTSRRYLTLEVADSGRGLSGSERREVFQPFYQVEGSLSRSQGGSGLGLAIVQQISRLMGGSLDLVSVRGEGSKFTVSVQLPVAEMPTQERETVALENMVDEADAFRILVAEDHPSNRKVIGKMLEAMGAEVQYATNGQEAVNAYRQKTPQLMLIDIQMPVMNGIDCLKTIRELERIEGRFQVPAVAVTANAMKHQIEQYLWEGFDDVIVKPIEIERLVKVVQHALNDERVPAQ